MADFNLGTSLTQNWDARGRVFYTDENGNKVDLNTPFLERVGNRLKAMAFNAGRWLTNENTESQDYKDKVSLLTGLVTMPFGMGKSATGALATKLTPRFGDKIANLAANSAGGGLVGGGAEGLTRGYLNNENMLKTGLQDAGLGFTLGLIGGAGGGYIGKSIAKRGLLNNEQAKTNYIYDYLTGLNSDKQKKELDEFRRLWSSGYNTRSEKPEIQFDLLADEFNAPENIPLTKTDNFKNWYGKSKTVDESGKPLTLSHGSVNTFDTFNKELASPESDLGAAFYFTNSASDVNSNYYGGGPDFDNKVVRLAERLADEEDIAYDIAKERAREELMGEPSKIDAYLKMENPLYIGKNETQLFDYDTYRQKAIDQYGLNPNDFDDIDAFEDEVRASIDAIFYDEPYNLTNNLYDILDSNDVEKVQGVITDTFYNGGTNFENLKSRLNDLYLENLETGDFVGNEVARRIVENLGYDGIIDSTVSKKFNMNLNPDTTHYVVFDPTQIKSVNNQGTFDANNPNIYKSILPIGGVSLFNLLQNKKDKI